MSNDIIEVCSFGNPGATTEPCYSPLDKCDCLPVSKVDDPDYEQPVYNVSITNDTIGVTCNFGNPGMSTSATIDVLKNCGLVDIGQIIRDELGIVEPPEPPVDDTLYVVHNGIKVVFGNKIVIFTKE